MHTIEGKNAVLDALKNGAEIDKLYIQNDDARRLGAILALAKERKIVVSHIGKQKMTELSQTGAHQGVIATVCTIQYAPLSALFESAKAKNQPPFVVIADGIMDPHNLGAIIRSANAAGADGVIIPSRRSSTVNATVDKVSAGAVHSIPIVRITNLSDTIKTLKDKGLWIYGTALDTDASLYDTDLTGPAAIIIGSEGQGMSPLVKKQCDFLMKIPMLGQTQSLNASVACGILLYEAVRQRQKGRS